MKLEVGMYVRTIGGIIDKVIIDYEGHCNNPNCNCKHISCKYNYYDENKVIKASHNIIDLIEVGDYVNGVRIDELSHNRFTNAKAVATNNSLRKDTGKQYWFENEDIKSIVTKEMFSNVEYRVETN